MTAAREKTGRCACGAVRFRVLAPDTYGACHCGMCRRWTGGVWMGVVCDAVLEIEGPVVEWASSMRADRAFCGECGAAVWYKPRVMSVPIFAQGLFDEQTGWRLTREICASDRPDHYALAETGQKAFTGWGVVWAALLGRLPK